MHKNLFLCFFSMTVFFLVSCASNTKHVANDNDNVLSDETAGADTAAIDQNQQPDGDVILPSCGNGTVNMGEVCDGDIKNCVDISSKLYTGGKAKCKPDCSGYDTLTCEEVLHQCGNTIVEGPELCDSDLKNCVEIDPVKYESGKAKCKTDCLGYDVVTCQEVKTECGNSIKEGAEVCDTETIACHTLDTKYKSGTATCNKACSGWVVTSCVEGTAQCGNTVIEGDEVCDGGLASCVDIDPARFKGGKAYCLENCTGWDETTCEALTSSVDWTGGVKKQAAFAARSGHAVVAFNNKLWLIGGAGKSQDGTTDVYYNDIWNSTNGSDWQLVQETAAFPARSRHSAAVFNGKIFLIGGTSSSGNLADIWSSANGINWTQITPDPAIAPGANFGLTVHQNKLWLVTGNIAFSTINYAYYSTDGQKWTQTDVGPALGGRYAFSLNSFSGKFRVFGGINASNQVFNDTFFTADGTAWDTGVCTFTARAFHQTVQLGGELFLLGGNSNDGTAAPRRNDVWKSTDGTTWEKVTDTAGYTPVSSHQSAVLGNKLCIIGGFKNDSLPTNEVWCTSITQ